MSPVLVRVIALLSFIIVVAPLKANSVTLAAAPFETYVSDEGEPSRLTSIVEAAFSRMQTNLELQVMRDAFLGSAVRSGKVDGEFAYIDLGERKDAITLSAPYLPIYLYATGKKYDVEEIMLIPHLKNSRVAIENRFANTPKFRLLKEVKWSRNPSTYDAFKQLADDRAPYLITTRLLIEEFNLLLEKDGEELLHVSSAALMNAGFSLALGDNTPNAKATIDAFEQTIQVMQQDGSYNKILGLPWLSKDINNDGIADYIGETSVSLVALDTPIAYPLDKALPGDNSVYVIDGITYESKAEAMAMLDGVKSQRESLLDPDVYKTMIRRW
jgi:ABC-type amino acid transport substrate-binding protein